MLKITDKDTVIAVLTVVTGGIFTLTVFSYTMVMNVLNRSINNYSPRLLPVLLAERHHQVVLGITAGTIIHSLLLFLGVSNAESEAAVPPFAAVLSILFAVLCLGLFVYFVHRISQSIHINYLLRRSFDQTVDLLNDMIALQPQLNFKEKEEDFAYAYKSNAVGYLSDYRLNDLAKTMKKAGGKLKIRHIAGSFVQRDEVYFYSSVKLSDQQEKKVRDSLRISFEEPLQIFTVGFKHLTEVAVKACSPAINDPGTALTAIDYLTGLFRLHTKLAPHNCYTGKNGGEVYLNVCSFENLLHKCYAEMLVYMKNDPILRRALKVSSDKIRTACDEQNQSEYAAAVVKMKRQIENFSSEI